MTCQRPYNWQVVESGFELKLAECQVQCQPGALSTRLLRAGLGWFVFPGLRCAVRNLFLFLETKA